MPQTMSIDNLQPAQAHIPYQNIFSCMTLYDKHSVPCSSAVLLPCAIYWTDHVLRMNQSEVDSYVKWTVMWRTPISGWFLRAGYTTWNRMKISRRETIFLIKSLDYHPDLWFFSLSKSSFFCVILIIAFVQTLSLWSPLFHFLSAQSETAGVLNS